MGPGVVPRPLKGVTRRPGPRQFLSLRRDGIHNAVVRCATELRHPVKFAVASHKQVAGWILPVAGSTGEIVDDTFSPTRSGPG